MEKTVAEIAAACCKAVGVEEHHVQEEAKGYVKERMEYIWSKYALRDTLILFRITPASAVVEDVPSGTLPVGRCYQLPVERVLKVGMEDQTLALGDLIGTFQRGGACFESGTSVYAIEQGRGSTPGTRLIRIVGAPGDEPFRLIVLGKKALPELADDDILPLSNCDYVIRPYVRADLWKRRRQFQKATAELQEGEAMVRTMLDEEQKQAMGTRRLTAGPLGGTYQRSPHRGAPLGYLGKVSAPSVPLWELDGEGNIVPAVLG